MFLSTGCSLLRAEGFSCSLGILYGGLGISKLQFFIKKIEIKFPAIIFFSILGHHALDPDPGSGSAIRKNAGSGSVSRSALNQCRSENLGTGTIYSTHGMNDDGTLKRDSIILCLNRDSTTRRLHRDRCRWYIVKCADKEATLAMAILQWELNHMITCKGDIFCYAHDKRILH